MRIERFELRSGYGYLNLDIPFNPKLTFLTGINGSGKTTVVRGLVAALSPSFSTISNLQFESLAVELELEGKHHRIAIGKSTDAFRIAVSGIPEALEIPIFKQASYEPSYKFSEREADFYREMHLTTASNAVAKFLEDLPTPMFLDLERRSQIPRNKRVPYEEAPLYRARSVLGGTLREGLMEAVELAEDSYRQFLARQQAYMNHLRRDLILTTFAPQDFGTTIIGIEAPDQLEANFEVRRQRRIVSQTLKDLDIEDPVVDKFFDDVEQTLRMIEGRDFRALLSDESGQKVLGEWLRVQPLLGQINRIVSIVEKHNEKIKRAQSEIDKFLDALNRFLGDGRKKLEFQANGRLRVRYEEVPIKGMGGLSSGERQLLVILTHLYFNSLARKANVLIIDEPELSLHVKWQEMFVSAMELASPNIQFILATHSPSIILDRTDACVDITELKSR
jgi:predicted ATPase